MNHRNVIFTFRMKDNTLLDLNYTLYDNPLVNKWWRMVISSIRHHKTLKYVTTNKTMDNVDDLMMSINNVLDYINQHYDKVLPKFTDPNELDNDILNYLHEEFEIYGDRIEELQQKGNWTPKMHDYFLSLNNYIHMIETAMHSEEDKFANFSCLIDFLPAGVHKNILPEERIFVNDKFEWGGLYLGYNTLGKDYLTIYPENDQEVIERDEVRVQERFATECWLNFGQTTWATNTERFYKWYKELPKSLQEKVPIDDPVALSLGRYKLGQLDVNQSLLDYHNVPNDWMVPARGEAYWSDHQPTIHDKWNREVFSQVDHLLEIHLIQDGDIVVQYDKVLDKGLMI